jgi:putative spermidine/putrescine transport system ATP-binding protein
MEKLVGQSVQFKRVSKQYGQQRILQDFDLDIRAGEFVTLLGPSGSGKTTALNIVAGFTELTSGDVLVGDKSIVGLPPEQRNIGMVFQGFSLFPHMNVFENVAFPLRMRHAKEQDIKSRVNKALEMVRMTEYAQRMPDQLSGGQRQRIALARAVVFEPAVLLMDECLSALDLRLREALQQELRRLHAELHNTVLFVTHDQKEALTLSDRVAVMQGGRIQQIGTPTEIYRRPESKFVAEFVGQVTLVHVTPQGHGRGYLTEFDVTVPFEGRNKSCIVLRPEHIKRRDTIDHDPENLVTFSGALIDSAFLGNSQSYMVRTKSGTVVEFQESHNQARVPLTLGNEVHLQFSMADAVVVPD